MLTKSVLLRAATCEIVRQEAEENLAEDAGDLVALDHALGLGRGGLRIDRILLQGLELAPVDAACRIDLLDREIDRHHAIFAERAKEARARGQVAEADRVRRLRQDDRGLVMSPAAAPAPRPASAWRRENRGVFSRSDIGVPPRTNAEPFWHRLILVSGLMPLVVICDHS